MADYSQLELRLGAYLSGDEKMIEGFKSGEDFHTRTFKEMYGRAPIEDKEKKIDERKIAKSINFGIWYGQGASGLAAVLKCKKSEAQEKLDLYLNTFTKVREYQTKIEREVLEKGYVVSKSGRMRRLPEVNSND
jgi:DNA polymerase-1